jgi:hypothetical protein
MLQKILNDTVKNPNLVLPEPRQVGKKKEPTIEELQALAAANLKKKKIR